MHAPHREISIIFDVFYRCNNSQATSPGNVIHILISFLCNGHSDTLYHNKLIITHSFDFGNSDVKKYYKSYIHITKDIFKESIASIIVGISLEDISCNKVISLAL